MVRVAGAGGNTALGIVGDGGIVEMPDPFASGTFTFSLPPAQTLGWTLLGDINVAPLPAPVPNGVNASVPSGVNTVNLGSWNKDLRLSETGTPSTNARSKGRVTIRYTISPCNGVMSFDVLKNWGNPATTVAGVDFAPPIIGPNCWGTGLATFSVDQVASDNGPDAIGFDQYYWNITNGLPTSNPAHLLGSAAYYTSADRSSITIDQNSGAFGTWLAAGGPYTIRACYGRCNPWDLGTALVLPTTAAPQTCVTKPMNPACPVPAFTGGFPTCINAVSPSLPVTFTPNNYSGACTYAWTRSNLAWTISAAANGGVTINSIGDANPCTFFLTVSSASCGSTVYTYTVNRTYNFTTAQMPLTYCTTTGTNVLTINLPTNATGNQTCWGAITPNPAGWSVSNVPGVPSAVRVTVPTSAAGSVNNILPIFSCACATPLNITINVRPGAPVITGPLCVPNSGVVNQTWNATSTGAGLNSFNWGNTMGMTAVGPNFTDAAGVFTPSGTIDGNVNVFTANVPTCPSTTTTYNVGREAVAPIVVQPSCYTLGYSCPSTAGLTGTASLSIQAANFSQNGAGSYTWTFPANTFFNNTGTTVQVTQNTNAAVVRTTTGVPSNSVPAPPAGYYDFTVCFTPDIVPPNTVSCAAACTTVTATGVSLGQPIYTPAGAIGYLAPPPGTPAGSTYFAYDCAIPGTYGSSVAFPNAINLTTNTAPSSNLLTMQMTVPGGCTWRPLPQTTQHKNMTVVNDNGAELTPAEQAESGVSVMPNPNDGVFILNLKQAFLQGSVQLLDVEGKQAAAPQRLVSGNNQMRYSELKPGTYILRITLDGKVMTQRIVVTDHD